MIFSWGSATKDKAKHEDEVASSTGGGTGGCPVKHTPAEKTPPPTGCPVKHSANSSGGCPVKHLANSDTASPLTMTTPPTSPLLDPRNFMPTRLSQQPAPGQRASLDTTRQMSTIPRAGGASEDDTTAGGVNATTSALTSAPTRTQEDTSAAAATTTTDAWVYPSEQQFYNALQRKGYETEERDVPTILAIHNDMNERCWQEVLRWERVARAGLVGDAQHATTREEQARADAEVRLVRFQGRPHELTPKAWLLHTLGYVRMEWRVWRR